MSQTKAELLDGKSATVNLKNPATADNSTMNLVLQTGETDIAANDIIGKISFQAPDEGTGTDAILVAAGIQATSEGDFSSSANATKLEFLTAASEAASSKMRLSSAGNLEVDGGIDIEGGAVFNEDSADVDFRVESNGKTHMLFVEGGTDRIGINESSPASQLHITGASGAGGTISLKRPDTAVTASQTLGAIEFITADSGSAGTAARILGEADGTGGEGKIVFATGTGGSTSTAWTITSGGDLLPGATDHGIHLGVTSAGDANLLDDYEEGTWTPHLEGNTNDEVDNYNSQSGVYTKVGRLVTLHCYINAGTKGTVNGDYMRVGNFPFTPEDTNSITFAAASIGYWMNFDINDAQLMATTYGSNAFAYLFKTSTDNGFTQVTTGNLDDNARIAMTATYTVAT